MIILAAIGLCLAGYLTYVHYLRHHAALLDQGLPL